MVALGIDLGEVMNQVRTGDCENNKERQHGAEGIERSMTPSIPTRLWQEDRRAVLA
jgi:hypothetical protein